MRLDRTKVTIKHLTSEDDDEFVDATPVERVMMVWPLTHEIWDVYKPGYAERRLQRNITALNRSES
jgi:hypothetical protein